VVAGPRDVIRFVGPTLAAIGFIEFGHAIDLEAEGIVRPGRLLVVELDCAFAADRGLAIEVVMITLQTKDQPLSTNDQIVLVQIIGDVVRGAATDDGSMVARIVVMIRMRQSPR